eukprot:scpid112904/ scgid19105/ 
MSWISAMDHTPCYTAIHISIQFNSGFCYHATKYMGHSYTVYTHIHHTCSFTLHYGCYASASSTNQSMKPIQQLKEILHKVGQVQLPYVNLSPVYTSRAHLGVCVCVAREGSEREREKE